MLKACIGVGRGGRKVWVGKEGKVKGRKRRGEGSQGKVRRDGSHEWGWEGSGDCG